MSRALGKTLAMKDFGELVGIAMKRKIDLLRLDQDDLLLEGNYRQYRQTSKSSSVIRPCHASPEGGVRSLVPSPSLSNTVFPTVPFQSSRATSSG